MGTTFAYEIRIDKDGNLIIPKEIIKEIGWKPNQRMIVYKPKDFKILVIHSKMGRKIVKKPGQYVMLLKYRGEIE